MFDIISFVSEKSLFILEQGGYVGVFLLSVLDRFLMALIPAEAILPLAGVLAGQGIFNFSALFTTVLIGNLLGEIALYFVSRHAGRWLVERYGKYLFIKKHELDHVEMLFQKHGGRLVFWGRLLPVVRMLIAIPAGIARMNFTQFFIYTLIGLLPYNFALLFIGYKMGERWSSITPYFERVEQIGLLVFIAAIAFYIYKHLKGRHAIHE